jgi:hypothetical protein
MLQYHDNNVTRAEVQIVRDEYNQRNNPVQYNLFNEEQRRCLQGAPSSLGFYLYDEDYNNCLKREALTAEISTVIEPGHDSDEGPTGFPPGPCLPLSPNTRLDVAV